VVERQFQVVERQSQVAERRSGPFRLNLTTVYTINNEGVFMGPTQGPYILQLCMGPLYFWRGLTPLTLPYFAH